ncbi:hypothetical protein ACFOHS_20420 [Jhaorihella thermophila]
MQLTPQAGWRVWIEDEAVLLVFDGTAWIGVTPDALQNLTRLSLGTTADAANPFSAKLNGALWTALTAPEGGSGNLCLALNKETGAGVLSFLLQSGFFRPGRAWSPRHRRPDPEGEPRWHSLARRADRRPRHRHREPAAKPAFQGLYQLRQLCRAHHLDENRHQHGRGQ